MDFCFARYDEICLPGMLDWESCNLAYQSKFFIDQYKYFGDNKREFESADYCPVTYKNGYSYLQTRYDSNGYQLYSDSIYESFGDNNHFYFQSSLRSLSSDLEDLKERCFKVASFDKNIFT